jgi:hypothetical protein
MKSQRQDASQQISFSFFFNIIWFGFEGDLLVFQRRQHILWFSFHLLGYAVRRLWHALGNGFLLYLENTKVNVQG